MGINDYSSTPSSNTTINGLNIGEGCSPSVINDAIRQIMADLKSDMPSKDNPVFTNTATVEGLFSYLYANDTDASLGGATSAALRLTAAGTDVAHFGFIGSDTLRMRSVAADMVIEADTGNTTPDSNILMRVDGGTVAEIEAAGMSVTGQFRLSDTSFCYMNITDQDGTLAGNKSSAVRLYAGENEAGSVGFPGSTDMRIRSLQNNLILEADVNNASASSSILMLVDGTSRLQVTPAGANVAGDLDVTGIATVGGNRVVTTAVSAIGSIVFALQVSGAAVLYGGTISGANIRPGGTTSGGGSTGDALTGTWQCLGQSEVGFFTMWQRVS